MINLLSIASLFNQKSAIDQLVAQYMALERRPLDQLQQRRDELGVRSAMFTELQNKIQTLRELAQDLRTGEGSAFAARKIASSDPTKVTATVSSAASTGTYVLENVVLARAHRVQSAAVGAAWAAGDAGTISVNGALIAVNAGTTLSQIVEAINRADYEAGRAVGASVVGGRLVLEAEAAGDGNRITVADVSGSVLGNIGLATTASTRVYHDATLWEGDPGQSTWTRTIELGSAQTVSRLAWSRDPSGADGDRTPIDYTLDYWDEASGAWRTLKTVSGLSLAAGETQVDAFYPVTTSRLRLTVTATNDGQAPAIGALDVYHEAGSFSQPELQQPQTGSLTVNGVALTITGNSGLSDVIHGVTLILKAEGGPVTLEVSDDTDSMRAKIDEFLQKLNDLLDYLKAKSAVVKDATGTYRWGPLSGHTLFTELRSGLLGDLQHRVDGLATGGLGRLAEVGIELDASLHFVVNDAAKLNDWLASNPTAVADLFGGSDGVAQRVYDRLTPFVEAPASGLGGTYTRKSYLQMELDALAADGERIGDRIAALEERLAQREISLQAQFARLQETLLLVVQQQSQLQAVLATTASQTGGAVL